MEMDGEHHHRPLDEEEKFGLSLLEISEMEGHLMNMFYGSQEVVFDCHHCGYLFKEFNWYQCESDGCEYILHPTCAKSPVDIPSFMHPYLGHDLEVITGCNTTSCAVCNTNGQNKMYGCKVCDFYIHPTCSLWPKSLFFHELHPKPHPLQLQVLFPMPSFDPSPPPSSPPPPPKPPIEPYSPPTPPPPPKWHLLQYKPSTTSPPSPPVSEPLQLQVTLSMPSPPPPMPHPIKYLYPPTKSRPAIAIPPPPPPPMPQPIKYMYPPTKSRPAIPPPPMPQPIQFKYLCPPTKPRPAIPAPAPAPPPPPPKPEHSPPRKEALVFSPPTHPFTCHACKETSDGLIFYHCGRCNESYHLACLLRFSLAYKNSHTDLSKELMEQ